MILSAKETMEIKEIPKYNEQGFFATDDYSTTQPYSYKEMTKIVRKSPELVGILNIIKTDILSDGFTFEGAKVHVERAKEFCKKNRFKNELAGALFDWELFGNSALWKGKISAAKFTEVLEKVASVTGIEMKETEIKQLLDEDVYTSKLIKHAPWSTMNIDLSEDKTSIKGFHQIVAGEKSIKFIPEEIIHAVFMNFDGRVYGFSPAEASINILTTLSLIKDLNGNFFQNGGTPDWMFILPKSMSGSPEVKKLEQTLRMYKQSRHKHGNLVFTGEVNPIQMNRFDKDMEFRQLAMYYTGIIALAFNMPMARVASIIGGEVGQNASGTDLSEAGYWKSISAAQDYWEDLLNTQLFEPEFKVNIKFNRSYLNDEIKEAQRDAQFISAVVPLVKAGFVDSHYIKEKMKIPDRYWKEDGDINLLQAGSSFGGAGGSPGSPPEETKKGDARQEYANRKQGEAKKAIERKEPDNKSI